MTRYVMQGGEDIFVYDQAAIIFQFMSCCCDKRLSESDGDDEGYIKCIESL